MNTDQYMLQAVFNIPIQEGYSCMDLDADIGFLDCQEKGGETITCPAVRVKTTKAFKDLTIGTSDNICYDD